MAYWRHYLNQCWLIISKVLRQSSQDIIITRSIKKLINKILKIALLKSHPELPGDNELMQKE